MNLSMVDGASGNTYSPTMEPENAPLEEEQESTNLANLIPLVLLDLVVFFI